MEEAVGEKTAVPAPAGVPIKLVIVISLVALLIGLGGAFAFLKWTGRHAAPDPTPGEPAAGRGEDGGRAHGAPAARASAPGAIFDLEPFIVNLADTPEIRYLKVTIKLELDRAEAGSELAARLPQVRDAILVLLTSKDSAGVRSPQGKFHLREEITQRVNQLLPRPGVRATYFTEFVVQ
jgi:flagellar FliL protein